MTTPKKSQQSRFLLLFCFTLNVNWLMYVVKKNFIVRFYADQYKIVISVCSHHTKYHVIWRSNSNPEHFPAYTVHVHIIIFSFWMCRNLSIISNRSYSAFKILWIVNLVWQAALFHYYTRCECGSVWHAMKWNVQILLHFSFSQVRLAAI